MSATTGSVYDAIGGEAAVDAAVELLYDKILGDPELSPFFAKVPLRRQKAQMRAFLTTALGGPDVYRGRDMASAHRRHAIEDHHFDLVAGHLVATLAELDVPADLVDRIVGVVAPLRGEVVQVAADRPAR